MTYWGKTMKEYRVLSIDAWGNSRDGYDWNAWYDQGTVELDTLDNTRHVLKQMREQGYLSEYSKGRVLVDDDQYNLVICDRNTRKPLFAIEYDS